jgi:capsular polysaccharide transport system permease protein
MIEYQHQGVIRRSIPTIWALISREMSTNYGKTPGGYIWAILEPAAGIALMTFFFSIAFRNPQIGISFPLFYATGMLPFTIYRDLSSKISKSLEFSSKLLIYPAVTFMDALLARLLLNVLTHVVICLIILGAILIFMETRAQLDVRWLFLAILASICVAFAVGTFNCIVFMKFPVWEQIWGIANRPMFMISTVFFLYDSTPEPFKSMLWYNPLIHIVGLMRRGIYPSYDAQYVSLTYLFAPPLIVTTFSLLLLRRHASSIR